MLIAQDAVAQRERKKQTLDWLREPMVEKNSVMCYDQERFRLLKDIVEERIR